MENNISLAKLLWAKDEVNRKPKNWMEYQKMNRERCRIRPRLNREKTNENER